MKDDLDTNSLLDDGLETGKKVMSAYEKAQRWSMYFMIGKVVLAFVVIVGILWGGYSLFTNVKDMVTVAVVSEAKEVASEKTAELKVKASDTVAKIKADVKAKLAAAKKKDGEDGNTGPQGIATTLFDFAKTVDDKISASIDGALVENGYHPDAPSRCALVSDNLNRIVCIPYSSDEISGNKYNWMNQSWKKGECAPVYSEAMDILKTNGKITENDHRLLLAKCVELRDESGNDQREARKRKMLEEL